MITSFHHLHFYCHTLEESVAFWCQAFHAEEVSRRSIRNMPAVELKLPNEICLIVHETKGEHIDPTLFPTGFNHIGFEVDDIYDEISRLTALANVTVQTPPQVTSSHTVAFIQGPEGVLIELLMKNT